MSDLGLNLLPPIVAANLGGLMWPIVVLLLLRSEGGWIKAVAFAAGALTVRLLQGLFFGYIFATVDESVGEAGPNLIASTLQLVAGVCLLISAVVSWRMGNDPDAPSQKWMRLTDRVSAPAAFAIAMGLLVFGLKQWLFTFAALAAIERAQLGWKTSVLAYLFFILGAQAMMLTPIIASALAPAQSARTLEAIQRWLERHNLKMVVAASLIFGTWFLWRGASGLLSLGGAAAVPKIHAN